MRIAIVRKKYTFHGGSEGYSEALVKRLAEEGQEVHIFAIEWTKEKDHSNIHFHRIPAFRFNSLVRDLSFAISAFFILKKQRGYFDIIQTHDKTIYQDIYRAGDGCHIEWLRQRLKRSGPISKVLTILNPYHWLILLLERSIFNSHRYKKVIAISELVKGNILEHYNDNVDVDDIVVVYNGVDLERFHPQNRQRYRTEIRRRYGLTEDEFAVLFTGSGFERKGLGYLLKAVEKIPGNVTVLVAGKGKEKPLKRFIKRQRVIFCGPQKEIHKFYAMADIFVSAPIYEPFGLVYLEALASGLPVITTRLSGASEIIEDGIHGYIVDEPEDTNTLSQRIALLMDSERRRVMGIEARRLAEKFSLENHIKRIYELYKDIKTRH